MKLQNCKEKVARVSRESGRSATKTNAPPVRSFAPRCHNSSPPAPRLVQGLLHASFKGMPRLAALVRYPDRSPCAKELRIQTGLAAPRLQDQIDRLRRQRRPIDIASLVDAPEHRSGIDSGFLDPPLQRFDRPTNQNDVRAVVRRCRLGAAEKPRSPRRCSSPVEAAGPRVGHSIEAKSIHAFGKFEE